MTKRDIKIYKLHTFGSSSGAFFAVVRVLFLTLRYCAFFIFLVSDLFFLNDWRHGGFHFLNRRGCRYRRCYHGHWWFADF